MRTEVFSYRSGEQVVPDVIASDIIRIIEGMDYTLHRYDIKHFKDDLSDKLKTVGWSGKVLLSTSSSISITSVKDDIGLCTQTGNMARMYADLIKLQAMYVDGKIKAAIFVAPTKDCAKDFGDNVVNNRRMINELTNVFSRVITVPMIIIGFDNEEG